MFEEENDADCLKDRIEEENVELLKNAGGFEYVNVSGRLEEKKDTEVFECDAIANKKQEDDDSDILLLKGESYSNAFLQTDSGFEEKFEEGMDNCGEDDDNFLQTVTESELDSFEEEEVAEC